jgi:hypothetical protein
MAGMISLLLCLDLTGHHDADHQREEGNTLDQSCGQNHSASNVTDSLGLTSNSFHGRSGQTTYAVAGTNHSDSSAKSGTESGQRSDDGKHGYILLIALGFRPVWFT